MAKTKLSEITPTGALAVNKLPDGRRKIKLRKDERKALKKQRLVEAAAALFLDLDQARTWNDIAAELELSPAQLKELTKSSEFDRAYNLLYPAVGHDPRYKAAQGALSDMLPLAVEQLSLLLSSDRTPPTVRLNAIKEVLNLNNVRQKGAEISDRNEMVKFLVEHNVNLPDVKITIPDEYREAIDADFTEVEED